MNKPIRRDRAGWWVTGRKKDGKMTLLGSFDSEEEASDVMYSAFSNDTGRCHYLNTRDKSRATSLLKYLLFSETHDLDGSMKRISHSM
jgi:ABC-type molybdenum transport system ATPase subunit/photorepair protein PhrA